MKYLILSLPGALRKVSFARGGGVKGIDQGPGSVGWSLVSTMIDRINWSLNFKSYFYVYTFS